MDLECAWKDRSNGVKFVEFWYFSWRSSACLAGEDGCSAVCNCPRDLPSCRPRMRLLGASIGQASFDWPACPLTAHVCATSISETQRFTMRLQPPFDSWPCTILNFIVSAPLFSCEHGSILGNAVSIFFLHFIFHYSMLIHFIFIQIEKILKNRK